MAYNKTTKPKTPRYEDNTKQLSFGTPGADDGINNYINSQALRGLVASAFTMTASPYEASIPNSAPFPILNVLNKHISGSYVGIKNLDGGNVQQYATSLNSKFLDYMDTAILRVGINYRYIPVAITPNDNDVQYGERIVENMIRSVSEVTSRLDSTTFTQLQINNYVVETDMPLPVDPIDGTTNRYDDTDVVIYSMAMVYQMILQNYALVFNNYNSFRLKMGEMVRVEYDRNQTILNSLFGLYNKAAFKTLWSSIAMNLYGEYFDKDFMYQVNTLLLAPSRKSEAVIDPLLELSACINLPNVFNVYINNPTADGDNLVQVFSLDTMRVNNQTFLQAVIEMSNLLSACGTLGWVRNMEAHGETPNIRFRQVCAYLEGFLDRLNHFKRQFIDLRTVFNVLGRVGINNWETNLRLGVTSASDAPVYHNFLVNDVYKLLLSGSSQVEFNNITKRFRTFSLWDVHAGIPQYDAYSGGAFLTFSTKEVVADADDDYSLGMIPIGLTFRGDGTEDHPVMNGYTRTGKFVNVYYRDRTAANSNQIDRLFPLASLDNLALRVPYTTSVLTDSEVSALTRTCLSIFGLFETAREIHVHPDILAVYQIELADLSNDMLTYAKAYAPFKTVGDVKPGLGFLGVSAK